MSYLDKIKNNKNKVQKRTQQIKKITVEETPRISVIKINGDDLEAAKEAAQSSDAGDISIKITGSKSKADDTEMSGKSIGNDSKKLFGRKSGEIKFDSDKELSDKQVKVSKNPNKLKQRSRFAHKRTESKSQRENLKLIVNAEPAPRSQRRMKTSGS